MKNYNKKLIIMFVMAFSIIFGNFTNAFAADNTYTDNLIPIMTTSTRPSGVVTSSGEYSEYWRHYYAFDHNNTDAGWIGDTIDYGWIQYQFPTPKKITKYTITNITGANSVRYPRSFSLEASNGSFNGEEVTLDTQTNLVFADGEKKTFICSNPPTVPYSFYRIVISDVGDVDGVYEPGLNEIEMMENVQDSTTSISLNKSSMTLTVGNSNQLNATTPAGVGVIWASSNSTIAKVDSTGKVTGVGKGQATITATMDDGSNISATCVVTVTEIGENPPLEPSGDGTLRIEMVDGNIKEYNVSDTEITDFIQWYKDRDRDKTELPIYKFSKGSSDLEYLVHDKIVGFEKR